MAVSSQTGACLVMLGGNDVVIASGAGPLATLGGEGNDVVHGGPGPNLIAGSGGADVLTGRNAADEIFGGPGSDVIHANDGNDVVGGGGGRDTIIAGSGADSIEGGLGADTINAGTGNDTIVPGPGRDVVNAGSGDDAVSIFDACELEAGEVLTGGGGMDTLFSPLPAADLAALGVVVVGFETVEITPAAPVFSECGCNGHGVAVAIEDESVTCECDPFWDGPTCTQCTAIGGCELHLSGRFPQALREAVFEQGAQLLAAAPVVTSPDLAAISAQVVLGVAGVARTVVVGTPTFVRVDEVTLDGAAFPQTTMTMDVAAVLKSSVPIESTLSFAHTGDHLRVAASQRIPAAVGRTGLFVLDTRCGQACYHRLVSADGYADVDDQGRIVLAGVVVAQAQLQAAIDALPEVTP